MPAHRLTSETIDDEAALRALLGAPSPQTLGKIAAKINDLTVSLIARAPFVALATADAEGRCDVSPRGDPPGFVRVIDERTLLLPERPGNKIADSLRNILSNPHVALLFVIPGVPDTFRVNGRATLTSDTALLAPSAVEGKAPKLGILIDIEEAYTHCAKAFLRSSLWEPDSFVARSELPSHGALMKSVQGDGFDGEQYDADRAARYAKREGFY